METHEHDRIVLNPIPHPRADVHRFGFDLDHPYVDLCWGATLGPTCTTLLRRARWLWIDEVPAELEVAELAASLGVGPRVGRNGPLWRSIERLERFKLARTQGQQIDIYSEVPPLSDQQLERLPDITREAHELLLARHLERIASPEKPFRERAELMRQQLNSLDISTPEQRGLSIQ